MTANSKRRGEQKSIEALSSDPSALHYLYRSPSPLLSLVSTIVAIGILAFGIHELQSRQSRQMSVGINLPANADKSDLPTLHLRDTGMEINGQPVALTDALFRLSGLSATQRGIIINYRSDTPSDRLAAALDLVNKAGFSEVSLQSENSASTSTSDLP